MKRSARGVRGLGGCVLGLLSMVVLGSAVHAQESAGDAADAARLVLVKVVDNGLG